MNNQVKTTFLFAIITALFMSIGVLLGGRQGMFIAFIFAAGMNFFTYWFSDQIVLKMYKAKEADQRKFPELYQIMSILALRAGMPIPRIFVLNQKSPNAFATGRDANNSVVAVTQGLLEIMNKEELTGVLAHELAHIKNKDILIGTMVATMAGAIMMLASMARWSAILGGGGGGNDDNRGGLGFVGLMIMSMLAPVAAVIIQMAVSRSREYLADSRGAAIAGNPMGLANALQKLGSYSDRPKINASPSTAHIFIVNPLSGKKFQQLFVTHPPVEERVHKLLGKNNDQIDTNKMNNKIRNMETAGKEFWNHLKH